MQLLVSHAVTIRSTLNVDNFSPLINKPGTYLEIMHRDHEKVK